MPPLPPLSRILHPDRTWLCNLAVRAALLSLPSALAHALLLAEIETRYGTGPVPAVPALLLVSTLIASLGTLICVVWAVLRACDPGPALILTFEGVILCDRAASSLAARPLFLRWRDIETLRAETGPFGRPTLHAFDRAGRRHQIATRALSLPQDRLTLACLAHMRANGLTVAQTRRDTPWRARCDWTLAPA